MNTKYELKKSYEGFPSKDSVILSGTFEQCQQELDSYKYLGRKHGADVVVSTPTMYSCDNYGNQGETVTFEIFDTGEEIFED